MAKRHSADDDLSGALAILNTIEAAAAVWEPANPVSESAVPEGPEPESAGPENEAPAIEKPESQEPESQEPAPLQAKDDEPAAEPVAEAVTAVVSEPDKAGVDMLAATVDSVAAATSPLLRLARGLDDEIDAIIAQASDTEVPSFSEKLLRRLRPGRVPQDLRRRDSVLTARLVKSLERAARLIAALDAHRQGMKVSLPRIEGDLIGRIEQAKSMDDETISVVTEQLANRQDVVEALIRHEANVNSLSHKLVIEIERGIVVMRALAGGQGLPLAEHFSADAQVALSNLLMLSGKDMLSMREVERRKHGIDEGFRHRFNLTSVQRGAQGASTGQSSKTEQASA